MPHGENRRGVQQGRTQRESLAGGGRINMMYVTFLIIALASMSINSIK